MNLVLFQGECVNKNNVHTNWIFTCIVGFGRSVRRRKSTTSNQHLYCIEMRLRLIHKFFVWSVGQVDVNVFGNNVECKIGKISAQDMAEL